MFLSFSVFSSLYLSFSSFFFFSLFLVLLSSLVIWYLTAAHTPPTCNTTNANTRTMGAETEFYGSQVGESSVINYSYTDKPWRLLVKDMYYFFVYSWALPWVLWPLFPFGSDEFDELYPSWPNLFCIAVHFVLVVFQLAALLALPFSLLFPVWVLGLGIGVFTLINWLLCKLLNGEGVEFHSDEKYAKALPEHAHEQWVFLNGVAVGLVFHV